jgi:phenylacetate-CoA ligase
MNAEGIVHGPVTNPLNTLHVMEQEQVTALVGIPVQVLQLARLSAANGSHHSMNLRSVLLSTDHVPSAIVKVIENTWGCEVYNHYGMTEMGLGGGVDCGARNGYHVREADMLFEIVDPASGRPAAQGEWGEVVFTTLTRNAMPLIRYRTGDISRLVPEPCPCGTVLRRLAHVDQRVLGNIHLPGGGILSQKEFDEALFAIDGLADFKVICAKKGRRVALALHVKYFDDAPKPREEEVVRALLGIPLLSSGADCGQISLDVSGWDAEDDVNPGTKKRRISSREGR